MLQVMSTTSLPWRKISSRSRVGRRAALEVQLPFELLVAVEILQRVGRADFERDERIAVAGLAELAEADAVGVRRGQLHVVDDLVPAGQLVVGADLEADKLLGRLAACPRRSAASAERPGERDGDAQRAAA